MIRLTKEQIVTMHKLLIIKTGGLDGIKDNGLLESAIQSPFQTFMGEELYPTIIKKASVLCYGLINNHAFFDGNKRIGILTMLTFLKLNGVVLTCTDNEIVQLGLGIASGNISHNEISNWIIQHC
jgi:death-on-curing protein